MKPSVLLVSKTHESHKQEKQNMRDSYRQFVNRWESAGKKALKVARNKALKETGRLIKRSDASVMVASPTGKRRMERRAR